jgi:hypothetical protein
VCRTSTSCGSSLDILAKVYFWFLLCRFGFWLFQG